MVSVIKFRYLVLLSSVCLLVGCKKEAEVSRSYPIVNTREVASISTEGAVFFGEIVSLGDEPIIDHGFVWGRSDLGLDINFSDRISLGKYEGNKLFSAEIKTTLEAKNEYRVRSFVKSSSHIVYGKVVSFISLGSGSPILKRIEPKTGKAGDKIKIFGNNFSFLKEKNVVLFDGKLSRVEEASDTLLLVSVPVGIKSASVKISVSVSGNAFFCPDTFFYKFPHIKEIYPLNATFNDTITIEGDNFSQSTTVFFEGVKSSLLSVDSSRILTIVPIKLNESACILNVNISEHVFNYVFRLSPVEIDSFSTDTIRKVNQELVIYGKNFNPNLNNNEVLVNGKKAMVIDVSRNFIKVLFPKEAIPNFYISTFQKIPIKIKVSGLSAEKPIFLVWESTWTRKKDFPGGGRLNATAFSSNNKGYFGTGYSPNAGFYNDFWEYDPKCDEWTQVEDLPGKPRVGASSFTINGFGYVGLGQNNSENFTDFYKFDYHLKKWFPVASYEGSGRSYAFSYVLNDEAYVGTGGALASNDNYKDVWKYNSYDNKWYLQKEFNLASRNAIGFSMNNNAYIYNKDIIYIERNNAWEVLKQTQISRNSLSSFVINDIAYLGFGTSDGYYGSSQLWFFNSTNVSTYSKPLDSYINGIWGQQVFVINNKAYFIGGKSGNSYLNHLWEFDPTKPE